MRLALAAASATWCVLLDVQDQTEIEVLGRWGERLPEEWTPLLTHPDFRDWLLGARHSGRVRSRRPLGSWGVLNCSRLSAVPEAGDSTLLLIGTDQTLEPLHRTIFRALLARSAEPLEPGGDDSVQDGPGRPDFPRIMEQLGSLEITELDLVSVVRRSVERSREMIGGTGAELGLVDQRNDAVRVLWSDLPDTANGQYTVPFGEDVIGRVAASGAPLVINDYPAWAERTPGAKPYRAVLGVPLKYKGAVIGALTVVDDRPERQFTDADAQLLELLSTQVAISIRNARLFQELGERIKAQRAAEGKMVEAARLAAIGEMAASVAHELNNPLTSIAGFSELLLDEFPEGSRQRENMQLVLSEARRAREVVRRLLDFSRREEHLRIPVNVNEVVSEVLALAQPLAVTQSVEIQFEAWEDLPPVLGDRSQLRQVFLNLVTNGIQAMTRGGQLMVQTALAARPSAWVEIRVRDPGVGIPPEYRQQIFEPFFTTKPVGSGTGLGLSISKNIIMDHGGEITVESAEGQGACFSVLLPVPDTETQEAA